MKCKRYKPSPNTEILNCSLCLCLTVWIPLKFGLYKLSSDLFYSKNAKHFCKAFDNNLNIFKKQNEKIQNKRK